MKANTVPLIECRECDGTGKIPLPSALLETLRLIPAGGAVALDIAHKVPGVTINAQNNRLEELRKLDFVTRIREGKFWRYHRTKNVRSGRAAK